MEIDWERELDGVIGGGAGDDRPPSDFVGPGRRALRRRRAVVTGASAAAVAVVIGLGVTVGGGAGLVGQGPTGAGFAVDPGTGEADEPLGESPDWTMTFCEPSEGIDAAATYDSTGELCLQPGAVIVDQIDGPLGPGKVGRRSVALEVELDDGSREFVLTSWRPGGRISTSSRPAVGALDDWVPSQVAAQQELNGGPSLGDRITLEPSGELVGGPGIEVVEVRDVDLGESFAAPGDPAVAAEITVDGQREMVLARRIDGETDVIRSSRTFRSLDALIADARERYDSGEGLL